MNSLPVAYSQTTITELMIPSYANFGGKIHGGILLSLMDKVAYACASKHAGAYCVTVSIGEVEFLQPVEVGELVHCRASVNYVGNSSMEIGIHVTAENVKEHVTKHTNSSYFTMVAKGEDERPKTVPPLLLENVEQVRRFIEAIKRKELKKDLHRRMAEVKTDTLSESDFVLLKGQRCDAKLKLDDEGRFLAG